jgi:hypothetical protein
MEGIRFVKPVKHGYQISENFWLYEGRCRCADHGLSIHDGFCGGAVIWDLKLLHLLEKIRERCGRVLIENLYRCWPYHVYLYANKGTPPQDSAHLTGEGADIHPMSPLVIPDDEDFLVTNGARGIGYWSKHGVVPGLITHVDTKGDRVRKWDYGPG